jgi:hypothetical protein
MIRDGGVVLKSRRRKVPQVEEKKSASIAAA